MVRQASLENKRTSKQEEKSQAEARIESSNSGLNRRTNTS